MDFNQEQIEHWITKIQNKDEESFQAFYEEWYPKVFYIALAITHHEADAKDAAQETMIEIHKSINKLRDAKYFKLWLNRIVLSKCNRIFRKRKAVTMDVEQKAYLLSKEEERSEFLPSDHMRRMSDTAVLEHLLKKLPLIYREVLVLMYYEQCSIKEIADILQVPEGTVKSRLSSAKQKLKEEIQAYEQENQIKLDFREEAFGLLLPLIYQSLENSHSVPFISVKYKPSFSFSSFMSAKAMIAALCVAIAGGGMGVASLLHQTGYSSAQDSGDIVYRDPVPFKDVLIHSDKEAYFVLMKYAHCEYERNQLNDGEKQTADLLVQALADHNGKYYSLWLNR